MNDIYICIFEATVLTDFYDTTMFTQTLKKQAQDWEIIEPSSLGILDDRRKKKKREKEKEMDGRDEI